MFTNSNYHFVIGYMPCSYSALTKDEIDETFVGGKKEKKKPIYEIEGFVLTIPEDVLENMLLEASKAKPKKN